jgi:ligand-binding SRPBCC domain-containing protein
MKPCVLQRQLWLPHRRDEVFQFFSDARNLERITPDWLHFAVLTPEPIDMHEGLLIDYRLRLRGIPLRWQSEITVWEPPHRFVDQQRRGPYSLWIHAHRFAETDGGTMACDEVMYKAPGGRFIDWLLVRREVEAIFDFREKKLREIFGGS